MRPGILFLKEMMSIYILYANIRENSVLNLEIIKILL
jgi:hypothetical protein